MAKFFKLGGLTAALAAMVFIAYFLYWYLMVYDGYRTTLKTKSEQLHLGITVQEITNLFREFEVGWATNYSSPKTETNYRFYMEHDHVQQWFSTNLTASRVLYFGPKRGLLWRDTCAIRFDTNGVIIGYEWEQPH